VRSHSHTMRLLYFSVVCDAIAMDPYTPFDSTNTSDNQRRLGWRFYTTNTFCCGRIHTWSLLQQRSTTAALNFHRQHLDQAYCFRAHSRTRTTTTIPILNISRNTHDLWDALLVVPIHTRTSRLTHKSPNIPVKCASVVVAAHVAIATGRATVQYGCG
jgi:hypothetical protein